MSQTAKTIHGEVEYETATCTNCNAEVMKSDAIYVGLDLKKRSCNGICNQKYESYKKTKPLCEYCADSVLEYDGGLFDETVAIPQIGDELLIVSFLFGVLYGITLLFVPGGIGILIVSVSAVLIASSIAAKW